MKYGDPETVNPCRLCGNAETAQGVSWCLPCIESIFFDAGFRMLGKFVNRMAGIACECLTCGRRSTPCLMNVKKGSGCIECAKDEAARRNRLRRLTEQEARESLALIGIELRGLYENATNLVEGRCQRCGDLVKVKVGKIRAKLNNGETAYGCRRCYLSARTLPLKEVKERCAAAGSEYLSGFTTIRNKIRVRCLTCGRERTRRASDILILGNGCWFCMPRNIYNSKKLIRAPFLANQPSFLYIFEFSDSDGTVFRKYGVGRIEVRGEGRLRTHQRNGGSLIDVRHADLLTVVAAEELIRKSVSRWSYIPANKDFTRGGYTECYTPDIDLDLDAFIEAAGRLIQKMISTEDGSDRSALSGAERFD
ncbi:hypothetical protein HS048_00825 [Planomonospora sp. ID91781]|uniref:hypothetical protein n=1 Tax=Planomonospora sp. ID91781 TaxID=2738135 RepID=UPI0018C413FF|nr:hypothetical protein [Planomonospora sp. ID91781]MBG0819308.1 hypothetical protein [Planomonospora sp. ID91781]